MTHPDLERIKNSLSSIYHCFVYYSEAPSSLLLALQKELPEISFDSWIERLSWGGVYINGKVAYHDVPLKTPMKLEYYQPKMPVDQQVNYYPKFSKDWIIYEDPDLLVCFKPAGLSCQKAKEQQKISLYQYLSDYYGSPIHLPSRLDFSTSGLILCSRNPATHGI
ncbi:MAG: pseudouridine synthase, partial [Candidatus Paceibacterota bacterium]